MFDQLWTTTDHLPIKAIEHDVAQAFLNYQTPIITAEVASGKTMRITTRCAQIIAEHSEEPVYVLTPTRILANNATDSIVGLMGGEEGLALVGCLNGVRANDASRVQSTNRLVFTTVGYALASGIVAKAHNIILDEAHEMSIDLSLTKALIHRRRRCGESVRLAIMSATLDAENECAYWGDGSQVFTAAGSAYPLTFIDEVSQKRSADGVALAVSRLLKDYDRQGVLVFVSGKAEIEDCARAITDRLYSDEFDHAYEIHKIHGSCSGEERRIACAPPKNKIKILIGTNVLESGISLSWVDGGVSSGFCKMMQVEGNVHRLVETHLPRWRIHQQTGRVRRFKEGVFILTSPMGMGRRPEMFDPDIVRLPLTELVMHCSQFEIPLEDLQFSRLETPSDQQVKKAIRELQVLGFVDVDLDHNITLTADGQLLENLPLSYRGGAAYCQAHRLGMLGQALPLIAYLETDDLRVSFVEPYGKGYKIWDRRSDIFNAIGCLYEIKYSQDNDVSTLCEKYNIRESKYQEYFNYLTSLEERLSIRSDFSIYKFITQSREGADRALVSLKQILFRSYATTLYAPRSSREVMFSSCVNDQWQLQVAEFSSSTAVARYQQWQVASGHLRTIKPKTGPAYTILESVTIFTEEDLKACWKAFGPAYLKMVLPPKIFERLRDGNPLPFPHKHQKSPHKAKRKPHWATR